MVFGANTYRLFAADAGLEYRGVRGEGSVGHPDGEPAGNIVSSTLEEPLDWVDATVASGDAVDVVARLKQASEVPLRSHGSLSMNRALMAAGLVDRVQVTIFPVITGKSGSDAIFEGAADFDLELIESRTLDGRYPGAHLPAEPACLSLLRGSRGPRGCGGPRSRGRSVRLGRPAERDRPVRFLPAATESRGRRAPAWPARFSRAPSLCHRRGECVRPAR